MPGLCSPADPRSKEPAREVSLAMSSWRPQHALCGALWGVPGDGALSWAIRGRNPSWGGTTLSWGPRFAPSDVEPVCCPAGAWSIYPEMLREGLKTMNRTARESTRTPAPSPPTGQVPVVQAPADITDESSRCSLPVGQSLLSGVLRKAASANGAPGTDSPRRRWRGIAHAQVLPPRVLKRESGTPTNPPSAETRGR
ncbi:hypothetical protein LX36DRAFT_72647 [Colletotrichum falcatum]|nr:hypothetical protein LX36DRAFT_72647 [Colletotrichum falcatum]